MCQKYVATGHLTGPRHRKKEGDHFLLDAWMGTAPRARSMTPSSEKGVRLLSTPQYSSLLGPVFKKTLLDHWGWSATNLVNAARAMRQRSGVSVKKKNVAWTSAAHMELAFINYNGSGMYSEAANAVVPYRTIDGNHRFF